MIQPVGCRGCLQSQIQCIIYRYCHTNRITVPHRIVDKHQKAVLKNVLKKSEAKKYKGNAIITCKWPKFNHYRGQTYSNFSPEFLASGGWKHSKSTGDYFTINAYKNNPALEIEGMENTFTGLGIHADTVAALKEYNITKPTNIQAQAIPHILKGYNVLYSAETGSGKTLAFLLPIIQRLLQYNQDFGVNYQSNRPFAVIIVPSRELADQICSVSNDIGKVLGYDSYSQGGGRRTQKLLRERYLRKMDILVATPGVLSKILSNQIYDLSRLQCLVLDEIDTLLDDSFSELVLRVITKFNIACSTMATESVRMSNPGLVSENVLEGNKNTENDFTNMDVEMTGLQLVMTGATIPRGLNQIAKDILPIDTLLRIKTNSLHRLMPHVSQKFFRVTTSGKFELLLKHLKLNQSKSMRTMVFCNKSSTLLYLERVLKENNIETLCLHGQLSSQDRENVFEKFQEGVCNMLLCTDLASRGLDTVHVNHVINYDFPHFISDYIHRTGRVGRVGSHSAGFVLSFVTHKYDVDLLWNIEASARRVTELHNVNANIKRKLNAVIKDKFHTNQNVKLLAD